MKTNVPLAIVALSYAPVAVGGNEAAYPTERVAEFVLGFVGRNRERHRIRRLIRDGRRYQRLRHSRLLVTCNSRMARSLRITQRNFQGASA